jgi:hypothetical protein
MALLGTAAAGWALAPPAAHPPAALPAAPAAMATERTYIMIKVLFVANAHLYQMCLINKMILYWDPQA